jgi:hypothetical protein
MYDPREHLKAFDGALPCTKTTKHFENQNCGNEALITIIREYQREKAT